MLSIPHIQEAYSIVTFNGGELATGAEDATHTKAMKTQYVFLAVMLKFAPSGTEAGKLA